MSLRVVFVPIHSRSSEFGCGGLLKKIYIVCVLLSSRFVSVVEEKLKELKATTITILQSIHYFTHTKTVSAIISY
jgi:hypothetical protein